MLKFPKRAEAGVLDIVFLAHFAGSPRHGMVFGHYHLARAWAEMGHRVTIIASGFAHTRFRQPDVTKLFTVEWIDGVRYVWVRTPRYDPGARVGRALNIVVFSLVTLALPLPIDRADIVISSSHHTLSFPAAERLARRFRARLVFEVRDLWPLTLIELGGVSPRHPFIRALQWAEDRAYRCADVVVSVFAGAKDYMVGRGMRPEKFAFVPNGIDADLPEEPLPDAHVNALEDLRSGGGLILGYAGRAELANALIPAVEALALPEARDWRFAILGYGSALDAVRQHAASLGVADRVLILEPVSRPQVSDFLRRIDTAYIGLSASSLFRHGVSPTKLNDYLLAAKPVAIAIDAAVDGLEEAKFGIQCNPSDPTTIARALQELSALGSQGRALMGRRGREWVLGNRTYRTLSKRFLDYVMSRPGLPGSAGPAPSG